MARIPSPAPLIAVPIPVADQLVDQPRGEELAGVHLVRRILSQQLQQVVRVDQPVAAAEAIVRTLLDVAGLAREVLAVR